MHATGVGVASAAGVAPEVEASLDAAIGRAREDGAEAILLGSGGLTGGADSLAARHGLAVIDAIEAAYVLLEAVGRIRLGNGKFERRQALNLLRRPNDRLL